MRVCIYGAASDDISEVYKQEVEKLGTMLAQNGHSLTFGGGANGVMGAAARGFTKGQGDILGISPGFFNVDGVLYDKCTDFIYTDTMRERKKLLEDNSDVFVIAPGGIGTLDEFFEILTLRQLERHNKEIVLFNVASYYASIESFFKMAVSENFISQKSIELLNIIDNADDLCNFISSLEKQE